jgi:hypothetical protein
VYLNKLMTAYSLISALFVRYGRCEEIPGDYPYVQDATDRERKNRGYSTWGQIEGGHLVDA